MSEVDFDELRNKARERFRARMRSIGECPGEAPEDESKSSTAEADDPGAVLIPLGGSRHFVVGVPSRRQLERMLHL